MLEATAAQRYEVTEMALSATESFNGFTLPDEVSPTGYFVTEDGIITEAWLEASFGDDQDIHAHASFELTEPTVLRPSYDLPDSESPDSGNSGSGTSVTAVGTLSFGGVERSDTKVQFTVLELSDAGAELDVLLTPPAELLTVTNEPAGVAAHFSFDAR